MPIRFRRFHTALALLALLAPRAAAAGSPSETSGRLPSDTRARALVVLIGDAGRAAELTLVLSELLNRQGVAPEFERRERFRASALLSESIDDARVWVFITESGPHVAKLYFRGPLGKRFLLRTLSLRNGLDELGRELIAQVVETSTVVLLRSEGGLSREEAKAGLSDQGEPGDAFEADDASPASRPAEAEVASDVEAAAPPIAKMQKTHLEYELSARGVAKWTGADLGLDHGAGLETALAWRSARAVLVRGRLSFEYIFGQLIDASAVSATIRTTALRAAVDVGAAFGSSALVVGLGGGVDLARISPKATPDSSLDLAPTSTGIIPVVRVEARYELTLGSFRMTAGLLGDASLVDTHYDVRRGAGQSRVATPWPVRPGMALTLGWCAPL